MRACACVRASAHDCVCVHVCKHTRMWKGLPYKLSIFPRLLKNTLTHTHESADCRSFLKNILLTTYHTHRKWRRSQDLSFATRGRERNHFPPSHLPQGKGKIAIVQTHLPSKTRCQTRVSPSRQLNAVCPHLNTIWLREHWFYWSSPTLANVLASPLSKGIAHSNHLWPTCGALSAQSRAVF